MIEGEEDSWRCWTVLGLGPGQDPDDIMIMYESTNHDSKWNLGAVAINNYITIKTTNPRNAVPREHLHQVGGAGEAEFTIDSPMEILSPAHAHADVQRVPTDHFKRRYPAGITLRICTGAPTRTIGSASGSRSTPNSSSAPSAPTLSAAFASASTPAPSTDT
ncbi:hypothetical protein BD779DRAFT_1715564 [Infundibulicybe gibba]|nr:hypothetical protein BD779DRAFT_1715564 [Infundibulicybe gibba]